MREPFSYTLTALQAYLARNAFYTTDCRRSTWWEDLVWGSVWPSEEQQAVRRAPLLSVWLVPHPDGDGVASLWNVCGPELQVAFSLRCREADGLEDPPCESLSEPEATLRTAWPSLHDLCCCCRHRLGHDYFGGMIFTAILLTLAYGYVPGFHL